MNISYDPTLINLFFALPAEEQLHLILVYFGWLPIAITIIYGVLLVWLHWRRMLFDQTLGYIYLAIDVPKGNEQSPKAVESLFTYFGGAHSNPNIFEIWWDGWFQQAFSFEIVCIDGYTQFLIRTPTQYRNLVESAVYSQYPDAEITEVNDYTENVPTMYPNDEYDVWGTEFMFARPDAYPIKTWKDFISEMPGKPEGQFKDPLASLMDLCSSLTVGEQLWFQILVYPHEMVAWPKEMQKEVGKILGEKTPTKGLFESLLGPLGPWVDMIFAEIFGSSLSSSSESADDQFKLMNLKPQQKKQIEAIQYKASKLGFLCKIRFVYVAKKEVKNVPKAVSGFVGYIKQFADLDLNNLKPDTAHTMTSTEYFFAESRLNAKKSRIVSAYKSRSGSRGRQKRIFNIEELATLWHFPVETTVKAPLIQKTTGKKAEPPISLPRSVETVDTRLFEAQASSNDDLFQTEKTDTNIITESAPKTYKRVNPESLIRKKKKPERMKEEPIDDDHNDKGAPPSNLPIING